MTTKSGVEGLKEYQHSHEELDTKIWRRARLQDRGSRDDTMLRQLLRVASYMSPAMVTSLWVLYQANNLLERPIREAFGNGTMRAKQAGDLYDACTSIQKLNLKNEVVVPVESHFRPKIENSSNERDNLATEIFTCALDIFETRILEPGITYGDSKKLLPIAKNALNEIFALPIFSKLPQDKKTSLKTRYDALNLERTNEGASLQNSRHSEETLGGTSTPPTRRP